MLVPAALADSTISVSNPLTTTTTASPFGTTKGHLAESEVIARFLADPKVHAWLKRYPPHPVTDASLSEGSWTVNVWSGKAGEIATGMVADDTGVVTEAWTGPAGRVAHGARLSRRVRRYEDQQPVHLARRSARCS